MLKISVVLPCYKTAGSLAELHERLRNMFVKAELAYEIIFVDDRSPDLDWDQIIHIAKDDPNVRGIRLARNFGQHTAITAGIDACDGDWVVVMDADLQDIPEEIPRLLAMANKGWDVVRARRIERQDSPIKRFYSHVYHRVFSWLSGRTTDPSISSFGVYNRKVIEAFKQYRERYRGFRTFIDFMGFERTAIEVKHGKRTIGRSGYTLRKSVNLAIENLIAFSDKPLKAIVKLGFFLSFASFCFALFYLFKAATGKIAVLGWPSLIVSVWLLGSLNIFMLGMLGLYLGRIFDQVRSCPVLFAICFCQVHWKTRISSCLF